jgi:hypothetical protein
VKWIFLLLLPSLLTGCATSLGRDDAIFVGELADVQYEPAPVDADMEKCQEQKNKICVTDAGGVQIGRFDEIKIVGSDAQRYKFYFRSPPHQGGYGWVKKSDIAYPEDFKAVGEWTGQRHWNLCDDYGCTVIDVAGDGHFTANYADNCSIKDYRGKCPEYCPFTGRYDSPQCSGSGLMAAYRGIYRLQYKGGMLTYLITVNEASICWAEAWIYFKSCLGPISWLKAKGVRS